MERFFLSLGSVFAFLAVALGAFGAHILKKHLDAEMLSIFETAVRYQMYHALALVVLALVLKTKPGTKAITAGWLFIAGMALFSGSLYILSITGIKWFGAITPLGGAAFLLGWIYIIIHALATNKPGTTK